MGQRRPNKLILREFAVDVRGRAPAHRRHQRMMLDEAGGRSAGAAALAYRAAADQFAS